VHVRKVGVWSVAAGRPRRLPDHEAFLESQLETWIQDDPSLVLEGMTWIGRQVVLPSTRLDLLGITPEGQWVVAELKCGTVGLGTLTQALQYAMQVGSMDAEALVGRLSVPDGERDRLLRLARGEGASPRPVVLLLVGTGQAPDLEQGLRFLRERGLTLTVRVVTFRLFRGAGGEVLLARDVEEQDQPEAQAAGSRTASVERVLELAAEGGVSESFREVIAMAHRRGLRTKAWPLSITVNSPANWRKTLLYFAPDSGQVHVGYSEENFDEAFGTCRDEVVAALGANWREIPVAEALPYVRQAEALLARLQARAQQTAATA
jgi:hypothetical protein